jgi:hypothetical protein
MYASLFMAKEQFSAQLCILDDIPFTVWNLLFSAATTFSLLPQVLGSDRALARCG